MNKHPKFFNLFKDDNDIEKGISDDLFKIFKASQNPHIICIYGDARLGKSTKMNQIVNGTKSADYFKLKTPFKTRVELHTTETKGCNFYGPIKVKDIIDNNDLDINEFDKNIINDDLFFVDTEGLKSIDPITKAFVSGILTILQIATIKILYIPILNNEKLEEISKNTKLSNILKLYENLSETIVLIRDIQLQEGNDIDKMRLELYEQKEICQNKINDYLNKLKEKNAICEVLPNYELAKRNIDKYQDCYKEQMHNLIFSIISNIKQNPNLTGIKITQLIKEFLDIFKKVKNIESLRNAEIAINQIILSLFKNKLEQIYANIKQGNLFNYLLSLGDNIDNIKNYIINSIKIDMKNTWDFFYDTIKQNIDMELDKYSYQILNDITKYYFKIKEKIQKDFDIFLNKIKNEYNTFLSKFNFIEQINKNELYSSVNKKINSFVNKHKAIIDIIKIRDNYYEYNLIKNAKDNINNNISYKIKSIPEWKFYKIQILNEIKKNVTGPFIHQLKSKNKKQIDLNINNQLNSLELKIQLYLVDHHFIIYNNSEFQKDLEPIYEEVKVILEDIIKTIRAEELKREQLVKRTIADGVYFIRPVKFQNKWYNKYLQMMNNNLVFWDRRYDSNQRFEIKYNQDKKYYNIKHIPTNQYIFTDIDTNVFGTDNGNYLQAQWHVVFSDDNNYEIISEFNGKYLGLMNNVQANNGNRISCIGKDDSNSINYKFIFEPVFTHFPKPDFHHPYSDPNSIVDALGSIGVDNTGEYRTMIGNRNGIPGAPLSPQYNIEMLRRIKEGSLLIP